MGSLSVPEIIAVLVSGPEGTVVAWESRLGQNVALQHLSVGCLRREHGKESSFRSGRGQDDPSESAIMQKGQRSLPEPTELGLCPEAGLPAANSGPIQFGCIMISKLIRVRSPRLETNTNILLTEQTSRFCQIGSCRGRSE